MKFFLCINNDGNPASLEVGKVYLGTRETPAKGLELLRII